MQLTFCDPDHPECSPHGPFRLEPTPGWELLAFVDFTSGLLVVRETNPDRSAGERSRGMVFLQRQSHVLDPSTGQALEPDQWKSYFDYSTHVRQSDDGRFQLTSQRVHGSTVGEEHFDETLLNLETGEEIVATWRHGFSRGEPADLLQRHLRQERERAERQAVLEAAVDASTYAARELAKLSDGDVVARYRQDGLEKQLVFTDKGFDLLVEGSGTAVQGFASLELFWSEVNPTGQEIFECDPAFIHGSLIALLVNSMNNFPRSSRLEENRRIMLWERFARHDGVHPDAHIQLCPHCGDNVKHRARYPTYVCKQCRSLGTVDEEGTIVTFTNVSASGGLRVNWWSDGEIVTSDDVQPFVCFIEGRRYVAMEAYMGGVVIFAETD